MLKTLRLQELSLWLYKIYLMGVTNQTDNEYLVEESLIELYKETLFDLLNNKNDKEECSVDIREDARGGIKIICITDILHQR